MYIFCINKDKSPVRIFFPPRLLAFWQYSHLQNTPGHSLQQQLYPKHHLHSDKATPPHIIVFQVISTVVINLFFFWFLRFPSLGARNLKATLTRPPPAKWVSLSGKASHFLSYYLYYSWRTTSGGFQFKNSFVKI